jgi:hypothetical protein
VSELFVLKKKIRDMMNDFADDLALGGAQDFHQYKHMTGVVAGLAMVEREILDLEKKKEDTD